MERLVGRTFDGPRGERAGDPPRADWARAYRSFDRQLGLSVASITTDGDRAGVRDVRS